MQVKYTHQSEVHEFELSGAAAEDLAVMCPEIEDLLRAAHPDLSSHQFLTEKITDAVLNHLADGAYVIDLGEISLEVRICQIMSDYLTSISFPNGKPIS